MNRARQVVALLLFLGVGGAWVFWSGWGLGPTGSDDAEVVMPSSKAADGMPKVGPRKPEPQEVLLPSSKAGVLDALEAYPGAFGELSDDPALFPSSKAGLPSKPFEAALDEVVDEEQEAVDE